jgi:hypothetical protein
MSTKCACRARGKLRPAIEFRQRNKFIRSPVDFSYLTCPQPVQEEEAALRLGLETAQINYRVASDDFWRIAREVFRPDHERKLEAATLAQDIARKALLLATRRLSGFLAHRPTADDFSRSGRKSQPS